MTTEPAPSAAAAAPAAPPPAAPAAAPAAPAPWYADEKFGFDQESRDYLGSKNFAGPGDLLKTARQFETIARDRNAIAAPVAGKEAEWEHWEKLGWVQDPAKYTVETPKVAAGVEWDPNVQNALMKIMHEQRVPLPAAKAIIDSLAQQVSSETQGMIADDAKYMQEQQAALRQEWGQDYDANFERAQRVVRAFGVKPEVIDQAADILGFANLTRMFAEIGSKLSEDTLVSGQGGGAMHAATARAQRLQLEADPAFMASITDSRHPQHQANIARRNQLLTQEAGGR